MSYATWAGVSYNIYDSWQKGVHGKNKGSGGQDQENYESETAEGNRRFEVGEDWKRAEWEQDQGQREYQQELEKDRYADAQGWQKTAWQQQQEQQDFDVTRQNEMTGSRREREDAINLGIQGRFEENKRRDIDRFDRLRGENLSRLDPYSAAGKAASSEQMALMGLSGQEAGAEAMGRFQESPGQKFIRERAQRSLLRNQSAIGGIGGGNVRSALVEQGAGFAAQDYDQQLRRLDALSGRGLSSAQTATGMGAGPEYGTGPQYVQTGTDRGVSSGDFVTRVAAPTLAERRAGPSRVAAPKKYVPEVTEQPTGPPPDEGSGIDLGGGYEGGYDEFGNKVRRKPGGEWEQYEEQQNYQLSNQSPDIRAY